MDPSVWGPACWRLMFAATFKLPRARCLVLFDSLRYLLPCVHCRRSYRLYLQRFPPSLAIDSSSPDAAARFAWVVKDSVNGKLGASALPFSVLRARHDVFESSVSRMDASDFLCCVAMQVDEQDQVDAYARYAGVLDDLLRACGEPLSMHLPLDAKYKSPATLWLHALRVKQDLCSSLGFPAPTRETMRARYRREGDGPSKPLPPPSSTPRSARLFSQPSSSSSALTPSTRPSTRSSSSSFPRTALRRGGRRGGR